MIKTIISYNIKEAVIEILERWFKKDVIESYIIVCHPGTELKKDHIHVIVDVDNDDAKLNALYEDPAIVSCDVNRRVLWMTGNLASVVYSLRDPNIEIHGNVKSKPMLAKYEDYKF